MRAPHTTDSSNFVLFAFENLIFATIDEQIDTALYFIHHADIHIIFF